MDPTNWIIAAILLPAFSALFIGALFLLEFGPRKGGCEECRKGIDH